MLARRRGLLPGLFLLTAGLFGAGPAEGQEKQVVGLIPRARHPIQLDGKLDDWEGAFVTPVHVGHPDFANRGGEFLFLWDDENLYVGQRCLDKKMAHVGRDDQVWNGDAVEFYLDTRRGDRLGAPEFTAGSLHMFWTPFTGSEIKPRLQVRPFKTNPLTALKGARLAARKTAWGYTAEFQLPWANFPGFTPKAGDVLGIDCELCSSDGGPRVDRTFVYSSPASVGSPASFGRVKLVDRIEPAMLKPLGRALLPLSVTRSADYPWLYATASISPTILKDVSRLEGKLLDSRGAVKQTSPGTRGDFETPAFALWRGQWELFDLPAGTYILQVTAYGRDNRVLTSRSVRVLHEKR
jgi:hypothetical protein